MILLTSLIVWVALFVWMAFSCWRAPVGYEDQAGFHYGSVPERDTHRAPRQRSRRHARRGSEPGRRLAV